MKKLNESDNEYRMNLRLTRANADAVGTLARVQGTSKTALINQAILEYAEDHSLEIADGQKLFNRYSAG